MMQKIKDYIKENAKRWMYAVLSLFGIPMLLSVIISLISTVSDQVTSFFVTDAASAVSFGNAFVNSFRAFFPIISLGMLILATIATLKSGGKHILTLVILGSLSVCLIWFWGGKDLLEKGKVKVEGHVANVCALGQEYAKLNKYKDAVKYYKRAAFLDKYAVLWNDNANLSDYYLEVAKAYSVDGNADKAAQYFEESLDSAKKYIPERDYKIAFIQINGALYLSLFGLNDTVFDYAFEANKYYREHQDTENLFAIANSYIFLANSYYNQGQYKEAGECFDTGIPLLYDAINWGFNDDEMAKLLAACYHIASSAYLKLGEREKFEYYDDLYRNFMEFRAFGEHEIQYVIDYYHWMKEKGHQLK